MIHQKISRNDRCRCGSGKKYKTCCLRGDRSGLTFLQTGEVKDSWIPPDATALEFSDQIPPATSYTPPESRDWRRVVIEVEAGPDDRLDAVLARTESWVAARGGIGTKFWLDLPHVGVEGWATIVSVGPCPPIEEGPGRLITGWFRHSRAWAYDLQVEGEPKPIGVTALHPFWSVDRQAWVPMIELKIGERLAGMDGSTPRVLSRTLRPGPEPVYNIEVEGDHCYRVGGQGLLVHNTSTPCDNLDWTAADLNDRWNVSTVAITVLPIGTPTTPTTVTVPHVSVAWIKKSDLRASTSDAEDRPGPDDVRWVRNIVGLPSPPFPFPDDAGHLIAHTLGGHGSHDDATHPNIFPQDTTVNTGGSWVASESMARKEAGNQCNRVCVQVTLQYPSSSDNPWSMFLARPKYLTYEVWSNGTKVVNTANIINVMRQ